MKWRYGAFLGLSLMGGLCVVFGLVYLMQYAETSYVLTNPSSQRERLELRQKLAAEIAKMGEEAATPWSWVHDADQGWPWWRAHVVLAIQEFWLKERSLPESMAQLVDAGYVVIEPSDLPRRHGWVITGEAGRWTLSNEAGTVIAVGN